MGVVTDELYNCQNPNEIRNSNSSFSTARAASSGDQVGDAFVGVTYTNKFFVGRGYFPVDTSGLPNGARIVSATLQLYVTSAAAYDNDEYAFLTVVQTSAASPESLVADDFDQCGALTNPDEGSARVNINSLTGNAYNDFELNANGISWIEKQGLTLLGLRSGNDILNNQPSLGANQINAANFDLVTNKPKLLITYILGSQAQVI